jgi:hypothetical protein
LSNPTGKLSGLVDQTGPESAQALRRQAKEEYDRRRSSRAASPLPKAETQKDQHVVIETSLSGNVGSSENLEPEATLERLLPEENM